MKNCPFCGGEAQTEILSGFETVFHDSSCTGTGDCPIEGLRGWDVEVWNSRPGEQAARVEELRNILEDTISAETASGVLFNISERIAELEAEIKEGG